MTDISEKNTGKKNLSRPILIAVLLGCSLFFSVFFLLSPEAFSQKYLDEGGASQEQDPASEGPKVSRYDFRLTENDTFYHFMSILNVPGADIQNIAKKARPIYDLRQLKKDTVLKVITVDDKLDKIEYGFNDFEVLLIERDGSGEFKASKSELAHETREVSVAGTIENSLYGDGLRAGADPQAVMALSDIFAWDVDFASDIRKGDTFSVLYEMLYVDGKPVKAGRVLGAEMVNDGKKYTAVYFGGGYYDADGKSLSRTLLKSPLRFRRITSYFSKRRFHPITKKYRPHHGIDYAAPTGTPIESAGSGRVTFAGWKRGYGNFIEIRHNNGYSTAYGHLSRIRKSIRTGAKVSQGDVIGYVGSTGISTGPHLHYEIRVAGRLVNPLGIKSVPNRSLAKGEKLRFAAVRDVVAKKLSGADVTVASGNTHPISEEIRLTSND